MKRSLRSWLWSVPLEKEVDEEIAFHVEMRTRELIERGIDPRVAREMAMARLGNVAHVRHSCLELGRKREREMRISRWFEELAGDVRFALRQLRRAPAFTLVAVVTLALGIGANSAIFALADAALLRPLPYPSADRLVAVWERNKTVPRLPISSLDFRDWVERQRSFDDLAGIFSYARTLTKRDGTVEMFPGQQVTPRFFDVLGVKPLLGRTFRPGDEALPPNAVVISEGLWRTQFGADPSVIGRAIRLDGQSFTVLGVVPADFQVLNRSSLWTVWTELPGMDGRGLRFMRVVGRLKPGVTVAAAQTDMEAVTASMARERPQAKKDVGIAIEPLRDLVIGSELRLTALLFLAVVGFVLLMCCANVANLLLARMSGRMREIAIRSALGAGRRRIVAQIVTESLVLAALGGLLGVGVGVVILRVAPALIPPNLLPVAVDLTFDYRVAAFCAAASLLVGVLFGLAPAWRSTAHSVAQVMSADGRGTTRDGGRLRNVLVAAEVAAAVLLLCGAGLLLRTLLALDGLDRGFGADNALTMQVSLSYGLPQSRFKDTESLQRFYDGVEREVARLPGVRSVAWGSGLPYEGSMYGRAPFTFVGEAVEETVAPRFAEYLPVSPGYFSTLEIPLLAGRGFTERDSAAGPQVCIVSAVFARSYLGGRSPLGVRISVPPTRLGSGPPVVREIVGVVGQVRGRTGADDVTHLYIPSAQNAWTLSALIVRPVTGDAGALGPAVRSAISRVDPGQPVTTVRTLDQVASDATARPRFRAVLVIVFAVLALVLAMVGVFGVLAYSVQQRTREFGVRMALGASAADVLRLVIRSSVRVTGIGVAIGLVAAAFLSRSLSTFLFGISPLDPLTFGGVALVLAATAAVATAAPALRAARIDPVVAFRNEA